MDQALGEVISARGNRLAELRDVLLGAQQASFRVHKADDLFYPNLVNSAAPAPEPPVAFATTTVMPARWPGRVGCSGPR